MVMGITIDLHQAFTGRKLDDIKSEVFDYCDKLTTIEGRRGLD